MQRNLAAPAAASLLVLAWFVAGCSGGNRQLESISISPAAGSGAPVSYTATGTFSTSPVMVTPLSVSWYIMGPAIDPPGPGYALAKGSYTASRCSEANPAALTYTVIAVAPANPNAPTSGSMPSQVFSDLVITHSKTSEDGFVAGIAQLSCK